MNTLDTLWQELLTSALLGTGRRPPSLPAAGGRLGELLARLDTAEAPHCLMEAAALVDKYRQAGRRPLRLSPQPLPPCEPETWERCGGAAAARLAALLEADPVGLLPEWLERAAAARKRAPEELLPALLKWGESHSDSLERLLPVLGRRGRWLARQAPWAEQVSVAAAVEALPRAEVASAWQTGRKPLRRQLLARLRQEDPSEALKLVESTWREDGAEERSSFVELLETGLSPADQPFLEAALDDRSKEVRRRAALALARLPDSRLVRRQRERAQACLQWKAGGFLRKAQIEVTLPESCDAGMVRDGVEPKRPVQKNRGEKADWLWQILSVVPPSTWSQSWGKSPAELIELAKNGDWKELLHEGWIAAAILHHDVEWAEALLKSYTRQGLLQAFPAGRQAAFLAGLLQARPQESMDLLFGYEAQWGPDLTRLFIRNLRAYYFKLNAMPPLYSLRAAFIRFARFMDPSLLSEAAKLLSEKSDPASVWEQAVQILLETLDIRRQMMEELTDA